MQVLSDFTHRDFRHTVGLFATGICVMTARIGEDIHGITINSFSSVSLEPPLILICLDRNAKMLERVQQTSEFALSFLSADQEAHSRRFASQVGGDDLEGPLFWGDGSPFLVGASGGLRCSVYQQVDAGDHVIVLGRVIALWQAQEPQGALLYYRGRYEQVRY